MHTYCLLLGSNIEADRHLKRAYAELASTVAVKAASDVWQSEAVGSSGPPYLNAALLIDSELEPEELKEQVITAIEQRLGRVRQANRWADRTIDIDIITFDGLTVDDELFDHAYSAVPVSQLLPAIQNEEGTSVAQIAATLAHRQQIRYRGTLCAREGECSMHTLQERGNYAEQAPEALSIFSKLEGYIIKSGLDRSLLELVKLRSSQINGCAYCIDMHTKDARERGESEQRLYGLSAWREAPFYTERERLVLAWTEALTNIAAHQVTDELYTEIRKHFTEKELVDLSWAIVAINGWNRMAIAFHAKAGSYKSDSPVAGR